ncbi:hypothetical protein NKH10_19420 [Mesorhizobium sp. M1340]|uniref:hypothetical protein n=1 Tax=Mesorhizobium sp. M1340 TaxID=2957087 RepID=UPI00333B070D
MLNDSRLMRHRSNRSEVFVMVEIIRNMVVADRGNARQFVKGPVPADVGADTIGRLRRAGALAPEAEEVDERETVEIADQRKGKTKAK